MNPLPITETEVPIPPWPPVVPTPTTVVPDSPSRWIPSTNILSPVANGAVKYPLSGVSKKQVTNPELLVCIERIPTPLELLIDIILWVLESNPWIGTNNSTSATVWFGTLAIKEELSITILSIELKSTKSGGLIYSFPPLTTLTDSITSRLSIFKVGEINASGLKVLSEAYSYPISTIRISLTVPIVVEIATRFAFLPLSLVTDVNPGNTL